MFKYTIEYTDFNGDTRQQEVAFNLSAMELINLQRDTPGGYAEMLTRVAEKGDGLEMWGVFEDLVKRSYGERSEDGTRFVKVAPDGHKLVDDFIQSAAYDEFMVKMITDADLGANFINKLIPQETIDKVKAAME